MDHSRNVLEVPSGSSISGRIPSLNPNQERDRLLTQLLFAARDLGRRQFTRPRHSEEFLCTECRFTQHDQKFLEHHELCSTGRVMRTLAGLLALPTFQIPYERSASRKSCEPVGATVEEPSRSLPALAFFGEPWTVNEVGEIRNAEGVLIVDPVGSELALGDELPYMLRIADCVNSFAGMPAPKQGGAQ